MKIRIRMRINKNKKIITRSEYILSASNFMYVISNPPKCQLRFTSLAKDTSKLISGSEHKNCHFPMPV